MPGTRVKLTGWEEEAFSRFSRQISSWKPGQLRWIKRAFSKKMRRLDRKEALNEATPD
jgi:hypothetical protein